MFDPSGTIFIPGLATFTGTQLLIQRLPPWFDLFCAILNLDFDVKVAISGKEFNHLRQVIFFFIPWIYWSND